MIRSRTASVTWGATRTSYISSRLDIPVALHSRAAGSKFVLRSRDDPDRCMSHAILNRMTQNVAERAEAAGLPLKPFTVHDLRRTGSTLRNRLQRRLDREVFGARGRGRSSYTVYNKAE